jgi:hypothetical protein
LIRFSLAGRQGSQEVAMQRMWMRAWVCAAVAAASLFVVEDAQAQGPVRRLLRRIFGRDYVVAENYTTTYYRGDGFMSGQAGAGADGMTYDAQGRLIGPAADRSARGGVNVEADTRIDGRAAPGARLDADADIRARGGTDVRGGADANIRARGNASGADAGARVQGNANADLNRNDGAIRGDAGARARGDAAAPPAPNQGNNRLPPPAPNDPAAPANPPAAPLP